MSRNVFELRERRTCAPLTDHLQLHLIQLCCPPDHDPKCAEPLDPWVHFFTAASDSEFKALAMTEPALFDSVALLERLSQEPSV